MSITKRVPAFDAAIVRAFDAWGGSWGLSWGNAWTGDIRSPARQTSRVFDEVAIMTTNRLSGSAVGNRTSRIEFMLLLDGDESGQLLLEGDAQSGSDALRLEGDEASVRSTVTKRVPHLS